VLMAELIDGGSAGQGRGPIRLRAFAGDRSLAEARFPAKRRGSPSPLMAASRGCGTARSHSDLPSHILDGAIEISHIAHFTK
jgi:hypothetical protein